MLVLKIKDNVNLQELEVLGFENELCSCLYKINDNLYLTVEPRTRILKIYCEVSNYTKEQPMLKFSLPAVILKLIRLDLVEFVEGGKQ